jgi:hypothetical protein
MSDSDDLTSSELDARDDAVLAAVREVFDRADPVPARLGDQVKFALTVQALEAEIAELQRTPLASSAARSVDYTRVQTVTFASGRLTAMVTINPIDRDRVRLDGWVTGGRVEVELRERSRSSTVETDENGRFVFDSVARGLAQFVIRPLDAESTQRPVITPSIEL